MVSYRVVKNAIFVNMGTVQNESDDFLSEVNGQRNVLVGIGLDQQL